MVDNAALCIQFQYVGLLKYGENGPICTTFTSVLVVYKIAQKSNTVVFFYEGVGWDTIWNQYMVLTSVCVMDNFQEFDFASKFELKSGLASLQSLWLSTRI